MAGARANSEAQPRAGPTRGPPGLPWVMADTSIFDDDRVSDDDRAEPPDGLAPEAAEGQVFPAEPVTAAEADEADVLEQAREEPLDEEPRE